MTTSTPREWDATAYHHLAQPQYEWAVRRLSSLDLTGDETVLDAGCGSGRVTERLLERLPRGRVIALDASRNMIEAAREYLTPAFADRVRFIHSDLLTFELDTSVDAVFSTAVFHWVLDHDRLFRRLHDVLRPGGRLHAQCGGGANVLRIRERCAEILSREPYAEHFARWREPWLFEGPEGAAVRLRAAGFVNVKTHLEGVTPVLPDAPTYRAFLASVVCASYVEVLPPELGERYLDAMTAAGENDSPPWSLDYVRLNLSATRPA